MVKVPNCLVPMRNDNWKQMELRLLATQLSAIHAGLSRRCTPVLRQFHLLIILSVFTFLRIGKLWGVAILVLS